MTRIRYNPFRRGKPRLLHRLLRLSDDRQGLWSEAVGGSSGSVLACWLPMWALLVLVSGCRESSAVIDVSTSRLSGVAEVYQKYRGTHAGERPADVAAPTTFTTERGGYTLKRLGISNAAELFLSERDGQPYVLFLEESQPRYDGQAVLGYEAEGVNGKKIIGLENGEVRLLNEQEFQKVEKAR